MLLERVIEGAAEGEEVREAVMRPVDTGFDTDTGFDSQHGGQLLEG